MRDWLAEGADPEDNETLEQQEAAQEWASWAHVHQLWLKHDKRCRCGKPITLDDAYYFGMCDDCLDTKQVIPF